MIKIAVANRKGGVGKSTSAVHLAAALALAGENVLLIDTDPQGHCSRILGIEPEAGLAELMDGTADPREALTPARENLYLLAGNHDLAGINRLLAREALSAYKLTETLEPYEGRFQYVIIDTAPGSTELGINVLFYADELLIPVSMEMLSVYGFAEFLQEIEKVKKHTEIDVKYILPTFYDDRVKKSSDILAQLKGRFGDKVMLPIRYSVRFSELAAYGKTIFEYEPKGRGSVDYTKAAELIS